MPHSDLIQLSRRIERSSPGDAQEQSAILEQLRGLRDELHTSHSADMAGCLDAASLMTEYLTQMGGIGPDGILRIVLRLVNIVRQSTQETAADGAPTPTQPRHDEHQVRASQPAHDPESKLLDRRPTWQELSSTDDNKGSLRMASDLILGEILVQLGATTHDLVDHALRNQRATGQRIGEALVELGAVDWEQIKHAIRVQEHVRSGMGGEGFPLAS